MFEEKSLLTAMLLLFVLVMLHGCSPAPNVAGGPEHFNIQNLASNDESLSKVFNFTEMDVLRPVFKFQNGEDGEYFGIIEALGGGAGKATTPAISAGNR